MTETTKTPEQLALEAAAAVTAKAAAAVAEKAQKAAAAAETKAKKATDAAAAKAKKESDKAEAKAKREATAAEKATAKAAADAAKGEAKPKMPEANGVRRPKADGACGKVWAFADQLSTQMGQPVPIAQLSAAASAAGINDSTIRTQYALWRKFHGITGRVTLPVPAAATVAGDATTGSPAA